MKLRTRIWLTLFLIVIVVLVGGYFTSSLPAPFPVRHEPKPEVTSSQPDVTTRELEPQVGRPFTFGNISYSIDKIDRAAEVRARSESVAASGVFLLVFLSMTNQGQEPVNIAASDFALYDSQGRRFSVHNEATRVADHLYDKNDLLSEAFQPGLTREGVLVFDVPGDIKTFSLRLFKGHLDVNLGI